MLETYREIYKHKYATIGQIYTDKPALEFSVFVGLYHFEVHSTSNELNVKNV